MVTGRGGKVALTQSYDSSLSKVLYTKKLFVGPPKTIGSLKLLKTESIRIN